MGRNSSAAHVARYGLLIALAFVLSYVEMMIPIQMAVPGMKLGLANLVTVVGLYTVGAGGTAVVSLLRIVLVGFTFSNMAALMYSLAGWALSMVLMMTAKKRRWFSSVGVSILGGVGHNIGQICVAALVMRQAGVFVYLPALMISGTLAGTAIGMAGGMVVERMGSLDKKM